MQIYDLTVGSECYLNFQVLVVIPIDALFLHFGALPIQRDASPHPITEIQLQYPILGSSVDLYNSAIKTVICFFQNLNLALWSINISCVWPFLPE